MRALVPVCAVYEIKFLRKTKGFSFVYPTDIHSVEKQDIEQVLDPPAIDKGGHDQFASSLFENYPMIF